MSTPILPYAMWESGTNQNSVPANDNSLRNQILNGFVISDSTTAEPALVSPGDDGKIYIIPAAATGTQWATFDEFDLAIFYGGTWYAFAPVEGIRVNLAGSLITWNGGAYIAIGGSGGGASIGVQYEADTGSTADSDPGPGLLKWNNATQASATVLFLDDNTTDGASLTGWWSALEAGGFCYLQHATDQDTWQIWEIGTITDAAGYVKLAVTLLADGGSFVDGDPMLVTLQQGAAGSGSGDVSGPASAVTDTVPLYDGTTGKLLKAGGKTIPQLMLQSIQIACSDETTNLTTGTAKVTFRMPYAFTLTAVRASLSEAQTAGSIFTVDINEAGSTILSTKLTIDNSEKTSVTAATPPVISDSSLADDAEITIDIDQVGTPLAKGLKVTLIGYPT